MCPQENEKPLITWCSQELGIESCPSEEEITLGPLKTEKTIGRDLILYGFDKNKGIYRVIGATSIESIAGDLDTHFDFHALQEDSIKAAESRGFRNPYAVIDGITKSTREQLELIMVDDYNTLVNGAPGDHYYYINDDTNSDESWKY